MPPGEERLHWTRAAPLILALSALAWVLGWMSVVAVSALS
jgi:hypothetical protein